MATGDVRALGSGYGLTSVTGVSPQVMLEQSGAQVIMDWYLKSMLDGHGYQIKAGTITTPLIGNVPIADTASEYCADPPAGYTILPVASIISVRLGTGTLHEYAIKSVAGASSAGAAFVPLPLLHGGAASLTTARVAATAGTVTVAAELATTTRRHWSFAQPIAMGAYNGPPPWEPRVPPAIRSVSGTLRCLYVQLGAATTGPSYYANLDFLEYVSNQIGL